MNERYVLDASALIALLKNEAGARAVSELIKNADKGEVQIFMHKLNLLEVYYDVYRFRGQEIADKIVNEVRHRPVDIVSQISDAVFSEAGRLKGSYKISLADSIALAEASVSKARLVTADHHEFDALEKAEAFHFFWIR